MTPGKNEKAYVAGTLNAQTARVHVVLDNYGIHKSKMTKAALREIPASACTSSRRIRRTTISSSGSAWTCTQT